VINAGWVTTFNQYAVVSENRVTRVADDFDPEAGALMGCAVTTAFGVINNDSRLHIGESIAVFGAGGVGLNIVQGAAMVAACPIIAIDVYDDRLKLAKKLGATHVINSRKSDTPAEIERIVGPGGVDVAVDLTGNVEVIQVAYELTGSSGRTILVGVPRKGEKTAIYTLPLHFDKILAGSHGGNARPQIDIPIYVRLCQAGKLELKQVIGKRYGLEEINNAISDLRGGKSVGRCMIHMAES